MEIKKILWPTDFSRAASTAESFVLSLSQKYNAEVHLLHVAEDLTQYEHYWGSGPDEKHIEELHEYGMQISKERLQELCQEKLTGCPRYQIHIVLGDPAKEILKAIKETGADLVVMANHGMKAVFPFGSVAEKVVKNSPVPVLTVNPNRKKE
jgi:nucleotide-binding universal stress UspA family protein